MVEKQREPILVDGGLELVEAHALVGEPLEQLLTRLALGPLEAVQQPGLIEIHGYIVAQTRRSLAGGPPSIGPVRQAIG